MEPACLAARRVLADACLRAGRESEALTVLLWQPPAMIELLGLSEGARTMLVWAAVR